MKYTKSNSHDPKTDHHSLTIICLIVGMAVLATVFAIIPKAGAVDPKPEKYASIDGCDVYRFKDEDGFNYFARCDNGKVATTDSKNNYIITESE